MSLCLDLSSNKNNSLNFKYKLDAGSFKVRDSKKIFHERKNLFFPINTALTLEGSHKLKTFKLTQLRLLSKSFLLLAEGELNLDKEKEGRLEGELGL